MAEHSKLYEEPENSFLKNATYEASSNYAICEDIMISLPHLFNSDYRNSLLQGDVITIVTGLPRSGTSLMMQMLEAGGLPVLSDNQRTADDDNPKGYYEFERVKKLRSGDNGWLGMACGNAIKVVSALLKYLPASYHYRVIFMQRNIYEVLASQRQMLERKGIQGGVGDHQMMLLFEEHLKNVKNWLAEQLQFEYITVSYSHLLVAPKKQVKLLHQFLRVNLDEQRMFGVVDPSLYHQQYTIQDQISPINVNNCRGIDK